ncbi:type II secretion system protein GspL [Parahaliea aestuarii]|uniref:Type II secretion system protein L n=1 Tax=Parahaliea aestuarii TaxID=1852021 RepID=A0A5C8ZKQ3_9GAMM|nr:type II secretion system protein GspL [Parahaliea aestuarii]TXS89033.1 hypothetical protein FVW59_19095 [Parahaliea aestuarii]
MNDHLILLRQHSAWESPNDSPCYDIEVFDGQHRESHSAIVTNEFPAHIEAKLKNAKVRKVLLIPTEMTTYFDLPLIQESVKKTRQATPFLIESQIATTLESEHIVLERSRNPTSVKVITIQRDVLAELLEPFEDRDIYFKEIYRDLDVTRKRDGVHFWIASRRVVIQAEGVYTAVSTDILPHYLASLPMRYETATVYSQSDTSSSVTRVITEKTGAKITMATQWSSWLELPDDLQFACINLAAGEFNRDTSLVGWSESLRFLLGALFFTLLGSIGAYSYEAHRINLVSKEEHAKAIGIYQSLFPDDKKIINVRVQTKQHLATQQDITATGVFHRLFNDAIIQLDGLTEHTIGGLQQVQFSASPLKLTISLSLNSAPDVERYQRKLSKLGYKVVIDSMTKHDASVVATLSVRSE